MLSFTQLSIMQILSWTLPSRNVLRLPKAGIRSLIAHLDSRISLKLRHVLPLRGTLEVPTFHFGDLRESEIRRTTSNPLLITICTIQLPKNGYWPLLATKAKGGGSYSHSSSFCSLLLFRAKADLNLAFRRRHKMGFTHVFATHRSRGSKGSPILRRPNRGFESLYWVSSSGIEAERPSKRCREPILCFQSSCRSLHLFSCINYTHARRVYFPR